jgi:hypothetical protein
MEKLTGSASRRAWRLPLLLLELEERCPATLPLTRRSKREVLMEGRVVSRVNQWFWMKAGSWRWSPISSIFWADLTAGRCVVCVVCVGGEGHR